MLNETALGEMFRQLRFISLLICMGPVQVPRLHLFWSTCEPFGGLTAPTVMPRKCFISFLGFPVRQTTDPRSDSKLHRTAPLLRHTNTVSMLHFQPGRYLSVDERMVKWKGRSGIRRSLRHKIAKWGRKLWVLADSNTGWLHSTGSHWHGLALDGVTSPCEDHFDQGYSWTIFTPLRLFLLHLLERKALACGTTRKDRKGLHVGKES
ncbi:hypothetical protein HPB48_009194 [Haemaphysalis longicornis]|uniref:PiggyBac transposable element-derived protein domain-containing protein n=1 Tax=Haemaphysalis longicornis TaxID=44386 RepID=A0A9J6FPR0_HAELO|nr:hypothetical protein HPB48_009194 [Haemaphysalis longicornis]